MSYTNTLKKNTVHADQGMVGVQMLFLGTFFMSTAHTHKKLALRASVYLMWFALVYLACQKIRPTAHNSETRRALYVVISMLQGVAMMLVTDNMAKAVSLQRLSSLWTVAGNICLGAVSGTSLGFYILAMSDMGLVHDAGGRAAVIVVCALLMSVSMAWVPSQSFAMCSAILGAYLFVLGVDCFAHTGYLSHLSVFTHLGLDAWYYAGPRAMVLQAVALVLALVSAAWQRWYALTRFRTILQTNGFLGLGSSLDAEPMRMQNE
ncbi:hypothetical protein LPJ66_000827 [Kickxella alabastrina]|uniref:Uncharacterized protein n=1 Tax=Kickxella alabastrina TaxID=61397 RepID=A0ACC1IV04_9FUNG|nr:hypothetical protein LPJ66_000827 [Kickxella alabastrina]